jgi:uncharacterized protein YjbI with pentapeptide repeats
MGLLNQYQLKRTPSNFSRIYGIILTILFGFWMFVSMMIASPAWAENYEKRDLANSDFSGQVLTDSEFDFADLKSSNFSHADLRGVSLFGAKMQFANFEGADLRYATLDTARFNKANLTNAILEGAFAYRTDFRGATIDGADFTDVVLRQDTEQELCAVAKGTNPVTGRNTRETLFCD